VPDIGPKRIAEFIKPFRVEPGRRVRLPRDFPAAEIPIDVVFADAAQIAATLRRICRRS